MARYIDADKFEKYILDRYNTMEMVGINQVVNFIKEQPTADVKEAVRGKWLHPKNESDPLWHLCSNCGKGQNQKFDVAKRHQNEWAGEIWFFPFCPYCGADMREDVE